MTTTIYELCEELLQYIDPAGEIIHGKGCEMCTCGLDNIINGIRTELEIERMNGQD